MPPITPGSAVSVIRSMMRSSAATAATPSGMPMPRFTTLLAASSSARGGDHLAQDRPLALRPDRPSARAFAGDAGL